MIVVKVLISHVTLEAMLSIAWWCGTVEQGECLEWLGDESNYARLLDDDREGWFLSLLIDICVLLEVFWQIEEK